MALWTDGTPFRTSLPTPVPPPFALLPWLSTAQYSNSFEAAHFAVEHPGVFSIHMHGIANEHFGDTVLSCVYSDWSEVYYNITRDRAFGLTPATRMPFPHDVSHLCGLSPSARAHTFERMSHFDKDLRPFQNWTDRELKSIRTVPAGLREWREREGGREGDRETERRKGRESERESETETETET